MAASGMLRLFRGYKDGLESNEIRKAWKALSNRKYYLRCTIQNETDQPIYYDGKDYFSSGRMFIQPPDDIQPKSQITFGVGGGSYSGDFLRSVGMGGVSGGVQFRLTTGQQFGLGFTDPIAGSRKAGVRWGSAEDGYNAASDKGNDCAANGYKITAMIDGEKRAAKYKVQKPG